MGTRHKVATDKDRGQSCLDELGPTLATKHSLKARSRKCDALSRNVWQHTGMGGKGEEILTFDNLMPMLGAIPSLRDDRRDPLPHGSDWPSIREAGSKPGVIRIRRIGLWAGSYGRRTQMRMNTDRQTNKPNSEVGRMTIVIGNSSTNIATMRKRREIAPRRAPYDNGPNQ